MFLQQAVYVKSILNNAPSNVESWWAGSRGAAAPEWIALVKVDFEWEVGRESRTWTHKLLDTVERRRWGMSCETQLELLLLFGYLYAVDKGVKWRLKISIKSGFKLQEFCF